MTSGLAALGNEQCCDSAFCSLTVTAFLI